jgi:DNA-binding FrmR family transcriptional regulator
MVSGEAQGHQGVLSQAAHPDRRPSPRPWPDVEQDRYCIDIVTQISAIHAALRRVEEELLRDHVAHGVEDAIATGNRAEQRRKVAELMSVLQRVER